MTKIEVIGLSGKAGSGKDFIAQNILKPLGYHQFSLAWHFKIGLVGESKASHEEVFKTKPEHVRRMLQQKGTEQGRDVFGDNVWCNHIKEWFIVLNENWGINKFVIPDVRFPNEVEFIQKMDGKVFRIFAPKRVECSPLSQEARNHISETALDHFPKEKFDAIIWNDPIHEDTIDAQIKEALGYLSSDFNEILQSIMVEGFSDIMEKINKEMRDLDYEI